MFDQDKPDVRFMTEYILFIMATGNRGIDR